MAGATVIAALYVETGGVYYGLEDVDPWDEQRDARLYAGPWPVVAHPPCNTWCQLAPVNEARWGTKIGDDEGCFRAALESVREFGVVLEHPAYSIAWATFQLPLPIRNGWQRSLYEDGWATEVSQVAYGHSSRKRTWLYYFGEEPPHSLNWREPPHTKVVGAGVHSGESAGRERDEDSSATPIPFRDELLSLARLSSLVSSG